MTSGHRLREAGKLGTGLPGPQEEWVQDTFVLASDSGQARPQNCVQQTSCSEHSEFVGI